MDFYQAVLDRLRKIARFSQMLVLRHVGDDEAERITLPSVSASLEFDRFVFHVLNATLVLGLRFGQEIRLESAFASCGSRVVPRRVHVDGDKDIAMIAVGNLAAVGESDECVRRARHQDIHASRAEHRCQLLGN